MSEESAPPPGRDRESAPGRSRKKGGPSIDYKYEACIDWNHYGPACCAEQTRLYSLSVAEMYWRVVSPVRQRELELSRNTPALLKDHGPFSHMRRAGTLPPPRPPKLDAAGNVIASKPVERVLYKDGDGEEFEVTADRKRKLSDVSAALGSLALCPLLVRIWERDGTPITADAQCACQRLGGATTMPAATAEGSGVVKKEEGGEGGGGVAEGVGSDAPPPKKLRPPSRPPADRSAARRPTGGGAAADREVGREGGREAEEEGTVL